MNTVLPQGNRDSTVMEKIKILLSYLTAFLLILTLCFILPKMMTGDPLMALYGDEALVVMTPQLQAELIERFALNKTLFEQFVAFWGALARGDLGESYAYNAPVAEIIVKALPWTLLLVGSAFILSALFGILLGIESGSRRNGRLDRSLLTCLMLLNGFPDFVMGILLLLLFGVLLAIFPLAGAVTPYSGETGFSLVIDILHHLALPLSTFILVRIPGIYLLTRNSMVMQMEEPYIMTARAKGCSECKVRYHHSARNSLLPVLTLIGTQMASIITGAIFVERVFSYPGLGNLLYESILNRDYPMIQGILLLMTLMVLTINLLVDLLYTRFDPRMAHA